MSRKSASPRNTKPAVALSAPSILLASIGAVSLGRKQALKSADEAGDRFIALRARLLGDFRSRQAKARKQIAALQKQADGFKAKTLRQLDKDVTGKLQPLRRQFDRLVKHGEQQVKTKVLPAIRPVLAKVGIQLPKAKRAAAPARKPAAKRRVAKAVRKVARRRA